MTRTFGWFLSSEEYSPEQLVDQAVLAEQAGFDALWISDHFHPWIDEQGHSAFVWSCIGAISRVCDLPVTTGRHLPDGSHSSRCHCSGGRDLGGVVGVRAFPARSGFG